MRLLLGVLVAWLVAGCAAAPQEPAEPLSVDEILSSTAGPETYGEPENCLSPAQYNRVEVLDRQHLLFWGRGDKAWLNRLRSPCVGLRRGATLVLELTTNRPCNLDSVTAVESSFRFWRRVSATCGLGPFEPISHAQGKALKDALKQ